MPRKYKTKIMKPESETKQEGTELNRLMADTDALIKRAKELIDSIKIEEQNEEAAS